MFGLMMDKLTRLFEKYSQEEIIIETKAEVKEPTKKCRIIELFNQGKSNKEIAIALRTNYNYVYRITKEIKDSRVQKENIA